MKITKQQLKQIIKEELAQVLDEQDVEPIETAATTDVDVPEVEETWNAKGAFADLDVKYASAMSAASQYRGLVQGMTSKENWYRPEHLQALDAGALDGSPASIGQAQDTIANLESYYDFDEKTPIAVKFLKDYVEKAGIHQQGITDLNKDPAKYKAVSEYGASIGAE